MATDVSEEPTVIFHGNLSIYDLSLQKIIIVVCPMAFPWKPNAKVVYVTQR
jgi:hypothetical protein